MPLPIAHSAAGLASYFAFINRNKKHEISKKEGVYLIGLCLFLAILPDLDFIPGFLVGEPGRFHHGPSHSLIVGLIGGLVFYRFAIYRFKGISKLRILGCCILSLLSHPILDYFAVDTSKPFGVPLLWPFSNEYYISSIPLFSDVHRNQESVGIFFKSLMNAHNGWCVLIESLFGGAIIFIIFAFKSRSRPFLSAIFCIVSVLCGLFYFIFSFSPI